MHRTIRASARPTHSPTRWSAPRLPSRNPMAGPVRVPPVAHPASTAPPRDRPRAARSTPPPGRHWARSASMPATFASIPVPRRPAPPMISTRAHSPSDRTSPSLRAPTSRVRPQGCDSSPTRWPIRCNTPRPAKPGSTAHRPAAVRKCPTSRPTRGRAASTRPPCPTTDCSFSSIARASIWPTTSGARTPPTTGPTCCAGSAPNAGSARRAGTRGWHSADSPPPRRCCTRWNRRARWVSRCAPPIPVKPPTAPRPAAR